MSALSCGDGGKLSGMWEVMFVPPSSRVQLCHCTLSILEGFFLWQMQQQLQPLPPEECAVKPVSTICMPLSRLSAAHCCEMPGPDPALLTWRMTPFVSRLCFLAVMTK